MQDLISVIVPVYNVSSYIVECLESLINQSYKNLEIILIDDGSKDQSGKICDQYATLDSRIKVIHQKNGGAANAKNSGLKIATGTYLAFADSDDYLEIDAYEHMMKVSKKYDADVVQCSYREIYVNRQKDCIVEGLEEFTTKEYLCRYTKDWTCGLLWDKLYKRQIFDNIFFEEGHIIDDEFFTYQGVMNAEKIVHDSKVVYNYRMRHSSVMRSAESRKRIIKDRIDYLSKRRKKVIGCFPELRHDFDRHFVEMMIILSQDPMRTIESDAMIRKQLRDYFKEKERTPIDSRLWPALLKIICGLTRNTPSDRTIPVENYFE